MEKYITVTFAATPAQKQLLEQWAKQDERSRSFIIRKAIECEARRRKQAKESKQTT